MTIFAAVEDLSQILCSHWATTEFEKNDQNRWLSGINGTVLSVPLKAFFYRLIYEKCELLAALMNYFGVQLTLSADERFLYSWQG
ncbi:MAG: hypothetical protein R2932_08315 [Caldilineaceae bacterium]